MNIIETHKLIKQYGSKSAVNKIDLKVPKGSIYGFLGPNGAGKTTTLKMITGLVKPTSGTIKVSGHQVKFGKYNKKVKIGYLPDVPNFYSYMTAWQYLKLCSKILKMNEKNMKKEIDYLLELVGLSNVKTKISGYSRGMKQRLGIAQALINQPEVIVLDEPVSALDPIGRKEVMDILAVLSGKVTILFSTHILSDVERICDQVAILDDGQIVLEGTIQQLREKYDTRKIIVETPSQYAQHLKTSFIDEDWVIKAKEKDQAIEVEVKDINEAGFKIPKVLSAKNIPLNGLIVKQPTLEDIFIKVVK